MPNQPTIILVIVSLSILSMFIFPNTIYYSLNLPQFQALERYLSDINRNSLCSPRRSCCE